ncbi:MAG TPA: hypothetical protein VFN08_06170 [Gemmatimonadales bacterium]|jgi:hypothetical protein|nr:hypothetical protein [Gemmatimonadales bacterium]
MIPSKIRLLVLCAGLAACKDSTPKMASLHDAMPFLPLPPEATFVQKSGGPDALQVTLRSTAKADAIASYYRGVLQKNGWRLVSDQTDKDGATVLFAESKGPPLWIRVQRAEDGNGTLVQLSGAVMAPRDSAGAKPAS